MPIAIVQSAKNAVVPASSVSVSFVTTPQIGNTVVACIYSSTGAAGCSDNQASGGNTYTLANPSGDGHKYIFTAPITKASGTFTITATTSQTGIIFIYEISGMTGTTVDFKVAADFLPNASPMLLSGTTTNPVDLLIAMISEDNGGSSSVFHPGYGPSNGLNFLDATDIGSGSDGAYAIGTGYLVASPAGSVTTGFVQNTPTGRAANYLLIAFGPEVTIGPAYVGIAEEHYIWSRKLTMAEHQAAMKGTPSPTNLILSCLMGNSPEIDLSSTGASGTVTGTTLVSGHP